MFTMTITMKKLYCIISTKENPIIVSIENLKNLKYHALWKKLVLSSIFCKCKNENEKIFKEEESIEMLKTFGFVENV